MLSLCACRHGYTQSDLDAAREEGFSEGKAYDTLDRLIVKQKAYDEGYAIGKAEGYNELVYEYNKALDLLNEEAEQDIRKAVELGFAPDALRREIERLKK